MRKLLLAAALVMSSFTAQAEMAVNVKTNPIVWLVGAMNAEVNFGVMENVSVGVGGLLWNVEILDVEMKAQQYHARADYWFNGAFKQGWYLAGSVSKMTIELETENSSGKKFEGDISGTGVFAHAGYHWQWESFNQNLGIQVGSFGFDKSLELTASDGSKEEEDIPGFSTVGLEYNIGWAF